MGPETRVSPEFSEKLDQDGPEANVPNLDVHESLSGVHKTFILSILCSAQFFDTFNSGSTVVALPEIQRDLVFSFGALQWVITAYTLTFAAFLLAAGRLSDIYHPKLVFCIGYITVGIFSVLCGVSVHPIMLLVFRAIQGIGAAMTLPSAIAMIIQNIPDSNAQGRALAMFGGFGAMGNVAGLVIGGVLTARVDWRWIFHLVGIIAIPISILAFFVLPKPSVPTQVDRKLDWQGVVALAGGLILFVYAISDGNETGWNKPQIIVTLFFSGVFVVGFFLIERHVKDPAVPPRTWTNENFLPLFFYALSVYWNVQSVQVQLVQVFQDLFHWSALSAALHCLPIGVTGVLFAFMTGIIAPYIPRRIILVGGQGLMLISTILFALADTPIKYWSLVFPGMVIGTIGLALGFVGANIAIMAGARKGEEGVVGAMMNTGFQLGTTVGVAISTAITIGVNKNFKLSLELDPQSQFKGYAASFWSILGLHVLEIVMTVIFVK